MANLSTTDQWTVTPNSGWDGLRLERGVASHAPGPNEYVVAFNAVSLNYRDVAMVMGKYPQDMRDGVVPCSDGVGKIVSVGASASEFRVGDRVCSVFNPAHQSGPITHKMMQSSLGNLADGTLRTLGVFTADGLVAAPDHLTDAEAATLPCAASTAYNCLFGQPGSILAPGEWVLTQGTGSVSLFAVQMALALGANVISTTSSDDKAQRLRDLGVQHVINYKTDADWGKTAKQFTPNQEGVHHVVEVGGDATMAQSLAAIRPEGLVSLVGFLGDGKEAKGPGYAACLKSRAIIRGMSVGPRENLRSCIEFLQKHSIRPIVDPHTFRFEEANQAFKYLWGGKHYGKVVIAF